MKAHGSRCNSVAGENHNNFQDKGAPGYIHISKQIRF